MDFTREPIIETVITPKEGCKLAVRSSKSPGQEEYFVDALEVISFGQALFFRSTERPKAFLVPATDYEVLEVREARMVLKNVGIDRTIKIAGGREAQMRTPREAPLEKVHESNGGHEVSLAMGSEVIEAAPSIAVVNGGKPAEGRVDKKRDRRRHQRRRRGRDGMANEEEGGESDIKADSLAEAQTLEGQHAVQHPDLAQQIATTSMLTSLLPPPPTLISDTIARYKDNELFKGAFYTKGKTPSSDEPMMSEATSEDFVPEEQMTQEPPSGVHFHSEMQTRYAEEHLPVSINEEQVNIVDDSISAPLNGNEI